MTNYDNWKTSPPEAVEIVLYACEECGDDLVAGQAVYKNEADELFCDRACAIDHFKKNGLEKVVLELPEREDR
jgi:hypothetical protein